MKPLPARLLSIDVFRAVTMLLMIFVNDVDSVKHVPAWIEHASPEADALGFADTIFPAFLFIVGLSLPFAIRNRLSKGQSFGQVALYIVTRSLALLIMGFFHVNLEEYSDTALLPKAVWEILITIAFFLVWLDYPPGLAKGKKYALTSTGIAVLVLMAVLFKGGTESHPAGLRTSWWGILGIIGWGHFMCATLFLLLRGSLPALVVALAVFVTVNILFHTDVLTGSLPIVGDASAISLIMAGVVVSGIYAAFAATRSQALWLFLSIAGVVAIAAGFVIRPYAEGISKIRSTPAWVLICTGISILFFQLMIYLVDVRGKYGWSRFIRPAGTSTLTVYLIPYLLYAVYALIGFHYPRLLNFGVGGIVRSFLVAFAVIFVAGLLEQKRIRLKV